MKERAWQNKDKYQKLSHQEIRTIFYIQGVDIKYQTHNKKGEVIKEEKIHYKMLYRTPGKAKKGSCMFINETLYELISIPSYASDVIINNKDIQPIKVEEKQISRRFYSE